MTNLAVGRFSKMGAFPREAVTRIAKGALGGGKSSGIVDRAKGKKKKIRRRRRKRNTTTFISDIPPMKFKAIRKKRRRTRRSKK